MNNIDEAALTEQILQLRPWHHDIELHAGFSTGKIFSPTGTLEPAENDGVSLISFRDRFHNRVKQLFPDGLTGKHFLDCACNGGGYCFSARELDAERVVGFDVRPHWIDQARFVMQHRTVAPVDRIEFHVSDLYDLPQRKLSPFDLTYFSGLFYHLPDPVTGLKIAADLTRDILILNTAMQPNPDQPGALVMARESRTHFMSGVHQLSWFPTGEETLREILRWLDFPEQVITMHKQKPELKRSRIEIVAAREKGRLDQLPGERLS